MVAQNIIMTVLNVIVLVALLVFGVYAVYNNKPNFELTPAHLYDQQSGAENTGIWGILFASSSAGSSRCPACSGR